MGNLDLGLIIAIVVLGCLGGLVSDLVSGLVRPLSNIRANRKLIGYDWGTLGTIIVGGATAFAFWSLGLSNPNAPAALGTAIISGFGGARLLNNMLEKQLLAETRDKLADELGSYIMDEPGETPGG